MGGLGAALVLDWRVATGYGYRYLSFITFLIICAGVLPVLASFRLSSISCTDPVLLFCVLGVKLGSSKCLFY